MPIEVYDTAKFAHDTKKRTNIMDTGRFHAWIHYYKPDQIDEMHCHNQDQTFTVVEGELTMTCVRSRAGRSTNSTTRRTKS